MPSDERPPTEVELLLARSPLGEPPHRLRQAVLDGARQHWRAKRWRISWALAAAAAALVVIDVVIGHIDGQLTRSAQVTTDASRFAAYEAIEATPSDIMTASSFWLLAGREVSIEDDKELP